MALLGSTLGCIAFLIGVPILGTDLLVWRDTGIWAPMSVGALWGYLDPRSMIIARFFIEDHVGSIVWNPLVVNILTWWAFLTAMGLGIGLLALGRRRDALRRDERQRSYRPRYLVNFDGR